MSSFRQDALADRVVWVTGGATGIGFGIAKTLAAHGARIALNGRKPDRLEAAAAALREVGCDALTVRADVRKPDEVDAVVAAIRERFGRLDALVNNAAGNFVAPAMALSPNGFGTVIDIDLKGSFHCARAAFPLLAERGGCVVSISATLHYTGTPFQVHAASAKAGIDAMTRVLANEWGPAGVRVNAVAPGPIAGTEGMDRLAPGEMGEQVAQSIPLRRLGRVDDIGDAVLFLVSDAARWITGEVLVVDGGHWFASAGPRWSM
jgi:peroxisomal 2,4-dienoyl-CoA reductase